MEDKLLNSSDNQSAQSATDAAQESTDTIDRRANGEQGDRRKNLADRRSGMDRRQRSAAESGYTGPERRSGVDRRTNLERRRGPGRRLSDERRSAEEGEMTPYQFEFIMAIDTYKKVNKRLYPTWTEILEIVYQLGYRKVLPRDLKLQAPEPPLFGQPEPRPDAEANERQY